MYKLLITGAWAADERMLKAVAGLGFEVYYMQDESGVLPCDAGDIDAVICNALFLYHNIERFSSLRFIQLTSAGYDRAPLDYIRSQGIAIFNAGNTYAVPMAEYSLFAALWFCKGAARFLDNQRGKKWEKNRGLIELYGKTVCIVGCGNVGTETAKRFSALGCKVIGVNRSEKTVGCFEKIYPLREMKSVLPESDIVILSIALVPETKGLMNREALALLRDGSVLVNISRGDIVDTEALSDLLAERRVFAALDVFETEPLPSDSPLWSLENVLLTPHNSFVGDGVRERLFGVIYENLKGFYKC